MPARPDPTKIGNEMEPDNAASRPEEKTVEILESVRQANRAWRRSVDLERKRKSERDAWVRYAHHVKGYSYAKIAYQLGTQRELAHKVSDEGLTEADLALIGVEITPQIREILAAKLETKTAVSNAASSPAESNGAGSGTSQVVPEGREREQEQPERDEKSPVHDQSLAGSDPRARDDRGDQETQTREPVEQGGPARAEDIDSKHVTPPFCRHGVRWGRCCEKE